MTHSPAKKTRVADLPAFKTLGIATIHRGYKCFASIITTFLSGPLFRASHFLGSQLIFKAELSDTENPALTTGHLGFPFLQLLTEADPAASALETEKNEQSKPFPPRY